MSIQNINFGCEFEYSTDFNTLSPIIKKSIRDIYGDKKLIVKEQHYLSTNNKVRWHLKTDVTTASELTTPISKLENLTSIIKIVKLIKKNNVKITNNDSIHVHVSVKGIPINQIICLWLLIEHTIIKCFKKHRRNNQHCEKLNTKKNKIIEKVFPDSFAVSMNHHAIVSTAYHPDRETVEFRVCHGTLDTDFIKNWIVFCLLFVERAKNIDILKIKKRNVSEINTPEQIIQELNIKNKSVQNFLKQNFNLY